MGEVFVGVKTPLPNLPPPHASMASALSCPGGDGGGLGDALRRWSGAAAGELGTGGEGGEERWGGDNKHQLKSLQGDK